MLIVVPLGVLQGALGMSILSVEPSVVPRYEVAGLLACFAVLCLLWLIATGVIKCVALAVRRTHCVSRKEIHRFFQVWIFCLFAVFIVMLFWMVNLIQ
jgi:cytochrome bd-type quinol oxidase subunit 2